MHDVQNKIMGLIRMKFIFMYLQLCSFLPSLL